MTVGRKIVQLSLISVGLILIIATYFLYPKIIENKFPEVEIVGDDMIKTSDDQRNSFENVEYKGLYDNDKPFTAKSEKAYILTKEPDVVYMTNMHVTLYINSERNIIITSDHGRYNKVTYDLFFEDNVKAIDGETTVFAENLDLLASKESASAYNNVFLISDKGSLQADKVDYDFERERYHISTFSNKKVKVKFIK